MSSSTIGFSPLGVDMFGNPIETPKKAPLADRFGVPPFSILSAREGDWQERKRAWLEHGIESECGRSAKSFNIHDWIGETEGKQRASGDGTSIFDPVLCELSYRWFCPPSGLVLDPFAGGSVRGVVAGLMGYAYHGIELRSEQVDANRTQAANICPASSVEWVCGDSMEKLDDAPEADFVFSCPPYGDLERYSDDPRDLSTMEYHTFAANYKRIILKSVKRLKPNRFACFVVGDFRDKRTGNYRNFVGDTVQAFIDAGCGYHNEAILVTAVGSLPIRVGKQFDASRKLGKTHQNILVFVKGDAKKATYAITA